MKTKKSKIILLALVFSLAVTVLLHASASPQPAGTAGSADDPLVTAGYVAKYVAEMLKEHDEVTKAMIEVAVKIAMQDITPAAQASSPPAVSSSGSVTAAYDLLVLNHNQKIRAKSGTLELILRPGAEATVMSKHADIGIADITAGKELLHGQTAPINNALLIPRADGRGLFITSEIAYILARGDYEIY